MCSSRPFLPTAWTLIFTPLCRLVRQKAPAGGTARGAAGFGLVGNVVRLLASYPPLTAGFAFYGAGWSVYSHLVARGSDVTFAKNTPMEIRFATDEEPIPTQAMPEQLASEKPGSARLQEPVGKP